MRRWTKGRNPFSFFRLGISFCLLIFLTTHPCYSSDLRSSQFSTHSIGQLKPTLKSPAIVDAIFIPQHKGWLVPLILPYLRIQSPFLPKILVLPEKRENGMDHFLPRLKGKKILSLATKETVAYHSKTLAETAHYMNIPEDPGQASLILAREFLLNAPEIAVTSETAAMCLTRLALFAGLHQLPILIKSHLVGDLELNSLLQSLKNKTIYQIGPVGQKRENSGFQSQLISLSFKDLDDIIPEKIGQQHIRNLIVVNPNPEEQANQQPESNAAYFVPFIGLYRNAPVLLTDSQKGQVTEEAIFDYIHKHQFIPKTITIVGDYDMTATVEASQELTQRVYKNKMKLEPVSTPTQKTALPFGVGRLPFCRLSCLSLYYARLSERDADLSVRKPTFSVISNLHSAEQEPLNLLEVISRITAAELKNNGFSGSEYYDVVSENADMWRAAHQSDLIIYEGHIEKFPFIKDPLPDVDPDDQQSNEYFDQLPFMVLQSCNSLKNTTELLERGVIGVIGSCTKVHSVSGSAFVKAFFDAVLYDGQNTGEALRDAKNFFLSLVSLKESRGHKQQDKTLRTALSFRFLGDPEVRIFPGTSHIPERQPVVGKLVTPTAIEIQTPKEMFPPITVDHFHLPLFPNAKPAGIVTKISQNHTQLNLVKGLYFFRFPLPKNGDIQLESFQLPTSRVSATQNALFIDPYKRWIYFLHYPPDQIPNQSLRFYFN